MTSRKRPTAGTVRSPAQRSNRPTIAGRSALLRRFRLLQDSAPVRRYGRACSQRDMVSPDLFPGDVQVGQCAFERIRGCGDRLRQSGMRMNGQSDIRRVAAGLDGERNLADQLAGIRTNDAATQY